MNLCLSRLPSRSKYDEIQGRYCQREKGHSGSCHEFPFLSDIAAANGAVKQKIIRDSTMTTGAAWKSDDAGPNRILRWVMLLSDEELLQFGINMAALKPQVVAKLREKAAPYEDCIASAKMLTWLAHQMTDAPEPSAWVKAYLEDNFGPMRPNSTCCIVCKEPLSFDLFGLAQRGKAEIETGHASPRQHNPDNIGFAHRVCNIAQGSRTLEEFYGWMEEVLKRVRARDPRDQTL